MRTNVVLALLPLLVLSSCMPVSQIMEGDELHDFWVFAHPIYSEKGLRIETGEQQYVFSEAPMLRFYGVETSVEGLALVLPLREEQHAVVPMLEAVRVWLPLDIEVCLDNGSRVSSQAGFWHLTFSRGVPQELVIFSPDAHTSGTWLPSRFMFNDIASLGYVRTYRSLILEALVPALLD